MFKLRLVPSTAVLLLGGVDSCSPGGWKSLTLGWRTHVPKLGAGLFAGGSVKAMLMDREWHATGNHPAWGMQCMWLGCISTTRVPQAFPCFPREKKALGLSGPPHPASSLPQEDSGSRVFQPAHNTAPRPALGKRWRVGGAGVTP